MDGTPLALDPAPFPQFASLLEACAPFAQLSGGRYTCEMFSRLDGKNSKEDQVRLEATPTVAEFVARIQSSDGVSCGALLQDFRVAEKMVTREGVFCAMVATCRSLELWPAKAGLSADDITYHDMSEPLECIAGRLFNFVRWRQDAHEDAPHKSKMLAASFVVEFGRAHGLARGTESDSWCDGVAETMMMEFLKRVKEWGERMRKNCNEVLPCLDPLTSPLRQKAESWWQSNWKGVAVGAGLLVGGAVLIGAGIALAKQISASQQGQQLSPAAGDTAGNGSRRLGGRQNSAAAGTSHGAGAPW